MLLILGLLLKVLTLSVKVGESLRAELSAARAKRATCCGAKRRSGVPHLS